MRGPRLRHLRVRARANPGICPICGDAFTKKCATQYICRADYCTTRYTRLYMYDRKEMAIEYGGEPSAEVKRFLKPAAIADLPETFMETAAYGIPPLKEKLSVLDYMAGEGFW